MDATILQQAVSRFQILLLSSYCLFLGKNGTSDEKIDGILREITSVEKQSDRKSLLTRASLINGLINSLVGKGWSLYRATELIFLTSISKTNIIKLRNHDFDILLAALTSKEYLEETFNSCLSVPFSIPILLKNHLDRVYPGNPYTLEKISSDIGYDKSELRVNENTLPARQSSQKGGRSNVAEPDTESNSERRTSLAEMPRYPVGGQNIERSQMSDPRPEDDYRWNISQSAPSTLSSAQNSDDALDMP
ncbi:hypothetical protein BU23DRAFT_565627 [Bimuria novae-zelandiae CBS 107.79]|uniref:Uncharacterized protein n=1 Tax=Bimuria novae-zelandiae CBS 107.79 TaxID=1447943 RepID=A0A6A5VH06_9PLEO|nr:hypothetical protein BU23DRAFT_565627 [Bimuria novae-zelandiae CBS 107.79]